MHMSDDKVLIPAFNSRTAISQRIQKTLSILRQTSGIYADITKISIKSFTFCATPYITKHK